MSYSSTPIRRWSTPLTVTRPITPRASQMQRIAFYDDLGRYLGSASFPLSNSTAAAQSKAIAVNAHTWAAI